MSPAAPAPARQAAGSRPAQKAYRRHVDGCPAWCHGCKALAADAEREDGRRHGWPDDPREWSGWAR